MTTTPRERPILFSAEMTRALLDNRKTQTRRVMKTQHRYMQTLRSDCDVINVKCPYGVAGDVLWVREAWRAPKSLDASDATKMASLCKDAGYRLPWAPVQYEADGHRENWAGVRDEIEGPPGRYRHARFMPRWASRITLTVTNVRVEQVQSITEADAIAEGCTGFDPEPASAGGTIHAWRGQSSAPDPRAHYAALWQRINGVESWNANPWVWVVTFAAKEIKR